MGASKKHQYSKNQLNFARIGRAISAPARVAILQHIYKNTATTNKELKSVLLLSETTVHQHLKVLVETGFIEGDFLGNVHAYYLKPAAKHDLHKIEWLLSKRK
ncbi:helix-turn-helix domain-containing protein [Fluviicola sp.]|jgi:DNA-binding transcriptional ArsR family regulator|uniref:helix-turn-helix domain-containing protein n=1 Tax=Fluviicola sp. TaxID=1917219 RepID=UPI0028231FE4|nr:helix-turn-helix domain-containing protein [Fluviicola sp.]MDR0801125.1 helix-turn-helix domain-containing protein [Fluviicola sp.]